MKPIKLIVLFFLFSNFAFGQYDPTAKKLLDQIAQNAESWKTVKIDFKATLTTAEPKTEEVHSGTLWQKGKKYKLNFMETETYVNGEKKWVYMPELGEVNVFTVGKGTKKGLFDNPQQLFKIYAEGFKYVLGGEEKLRGKDLQLVELVPENQKVEYFKIKVWIDKKERRIERIIYFAKDGGRVTIEVQKYSVNEPMNDSMFEFDTKAYPDVTIIDMGE